MRIGPGRTIGCHRLQHAVRCVGAINGRAGVAEAGDPRAVTRVVANADLAGQGDTGGVATGGVVQPQADGAPSDVIGTVQPLDRGADLGLNRLAQELVP
jgi:hypothetical protein